MEEEDEEEEEEESVVRAWSVMPLLSDCCPSLPSDVTQGWRRICSRVGRSDGCWLRHQPISCSHSVTETREGEEEEQTDRNVLLEQQRLFLSFRQIFLNLNLKPAPEFKADRTSNPDSPEEIFRLK